jgi:transglutaminase-like putative cysteine protease
LEGAPPHRRLEIESRVAVENLPLTLSEREQEATLEAYSGAALRERTWTYLQKSMFVSRSPEVWRTALDVTAGFRPVFGQVRAIMHWIHGEFSYRPGATRVNTHLEEAFRLREGVCQDFTHVMIGMCREIGIPARYASGYLYNGPADSLIGSQASLAWCEVYLPDSGWIGFDPTNDTLADARYLKMAVGRDYHDVAPIKGTYCGTPRCEMQVEVVVEKQDG